MSAYVQDWVILKEYDMTCHDIWKGHGLAMSSWYAEHLCNTIGKSLHEWQNYSLDMKRDRPPDCQTDRQTDKRCNNYIA